MNLRVSLDFPYIVQGLGMVFAPILFESAYLAITKGSGFGGSLSLLTFVASVGIGFAFFWPFSRGVRRRSFATGMYLFLATFFLFVYSFVFACVVSGDCL